MAILACAGSGSDGNAYAVIMNHEILLMDCGVNWKEILRMIDYRVSDVIGCLVTHIHKDHSLSAGEAARAGITVYSNKETIDCLKRQETAKMEAVEPMRKTKIGSFSVTPFLVPHTTKDQETGEVSQCQNYGYLIETEKEDMGKLLYVTDFEFIKYRFRNLRINHFLIECNHTDDVVGKDTGAYEHVLRGHSSLGTVSRFLEENVTSDTQNIILCHLSKKNADSDKIREEIVEKTGVEPSISSKSKKLAELNRVPEWAREV